MSYREGAGSSFFNGKENKCISGKRNEVHYDTDEKKLGFMQKFGWLIDDNDVKGYSAKYKGKV